MEARDHFPTNWQEVTQKIDAIDPVAYSKTRNFADGAITRLSPYISRGVISTRFVYERLMQRYPLESCEKLIQELAWRDYWQRLWQLNGMGIFDDLKNPQENVVHSGIPKAVMAAETGVDALDEGITHLKKTGYMHNHMRMYIASVCCNMARCQWLEPANWMYYHLLDGDLASNHLSWQWVAGTNAKKKYYANQENINRFFYSEQKGTFLDYAYEELPLLPVPEVLKPVVSLGRQTMDLRHLSSDVPNPNEKTLIYNYYNLDPNWHANEKCQRVFLIEPSIFSAYPVAQKCLDFALELGRNIPELKVFVGEFTDLEKALGTSEIVYKEHPMNGHYSGKEESRDWLCPETEKMQSFFAFWKPCKKFLKRELNAN